METETFFRFATLPRAGVDEKNRTVTLSFSSETPVNQGSYDEVLSHLPNEMSMARIHEAAVLLNHDTKAQVGGVVKAWNDGQKGRAVIRISKSNRGEEVWQDIKDGILKQVSVGYRRLKAVAKQKLAEGRDLVRFAWEPYEISLVSVAADPSVGIGRSANFFTMNEEQEDNNLTRAERRAELGPEWQRKQITATLDELCIQFRQSPDVQARLREEGARALLTGENLLDFNKRILALLPGIRKTEAYLAPSSGIPPEMMKECSLTRAISCIIKKGHLDGPELEMHRALETQYGPAEGFYFPNQYFQRDMTVGTFGQGGAFVQTTLATTPIEILRNRMVTQRLGVQSMSGLQGNVAIPRQTAAATAYSLPETSALTVSNQQIDQIVLVPHRVGAVGVYSKQLLLQSSVDVENFMRDDLMKVVAVKWDKLVLEGGGSNSEPAGILNTVGIGTVTFGGAPTFTKIVDFETSLSLANADLGRMAYITTPSTKAKLKVTTKVASSTFPIFIWEDSEYDDGSNDGKVNGYRAACTNQISNNAVVFGNFSDCIMAMWGGFDFVIDPYTLAKNAEVQITINTFGDVATRHAASFAWSTDAGNQS